MTWRWLLMVTMVMLLKTTKADNTDSLLLDGNDASTDRRQNNVQRIPDVTLSCGDCIEWQVYQGQQSGFGQQIPKALTPTQCQRACVLKSNCIGFDYDRSSLPCWLHLAEENFSINSTYRVNKRDCYQYRLKRGCKSTSFANLLCEQIHETCIDGANYFKSTCLRQASTSQSTFNRYLDEDFIEKCQTACRGNEYCVKYCDVIKTNGFQLSSQQLEQNVARCNVDYNRRAADCNTNFLTCI